MSESLNKIWSVEHQHLFHQTHCVVSFEKWRTRLLYRLNKAAKKNDVLWHPRTCSKSNVQWVTQKSYLEGWDEAWLRDQLIVRRYIDSAALTSKS